MAENLIYGKSITDFGAVGDGKTDCTSAFIEAFDGRESLIAVPYGKYVVKSEIVIGGNVKIICHPRAEISFCGITAGEKARSIFISGGIWNSNDGENCAFDISGCTKGIFENLEIHTSSDVAVGICDSSNLIFENIKLYSDSETVADGFMLGGDIRFVRIKNAEFFDCSNAIELASGSDVYGLNADEIKGNTCETAIFAKNCAFASSVINGISGSFLLNALHFEGAEINGVSVRNLAVCDGYVYAEDTAMLSFELEHFTRQTELETDLSKPSFVMKNCPESTLIFDGIPLDAIILAKKSVPSVKMTAAKMASPTPSVNGYTLELAIARKDCFIVPCSGFDSLNVNCNCEM